MRTRWVDSPPQVIRIPPPTLLRTNPPHLPSFHPSIPGFPVVHPVQEYVCAGPCGCLSVYGAPVVQLRPHIGFAPVRGVCDWSGWVHESHVNYVHPLLGWRVSHLTLGGPLKKFLLPLGIAALVLSGCSSESGDPAAAEAQETQTAAATPTASPSATEEAVTLSSGSYTFETAFSGVGTLQVPGTPDPEIEAMRVKVGAPAVAYLTGNFDNREGAEEFLIHSATVYDNAGNAYEYARAKDYVFELLPGTEDPTYNEHVAFYDSVSSSKVAPMERADFVLVGPELPADIAGVNVSDGYEMFGAAPA